MHRGCFVSPSPFSPHLLEAHARAALLDRVGELHQCAGDGRALEHVGIVQHARRKREARKHRAHDLEADGSRGVVLRRAVCCRVRVSDRANVVDVAEG